MEPRLPQTCLPRGQSDSSVRSKTKRGRGHRAPWNRNAARLHEEPEVLTLRCDAGQLFGAGGAGRPPEVKPAISGPGEFLIKRLTFFLMILAHSFQENLICNHYDKNEYSSKRLINSYYMTGETEGHNPDNSSSPAFDSGPLILIGPLIFIDKAE